MSEPTNDNTPIQNDAADHAVPTSDLTAPVEATKPTSASEFRKTSQERKEGQLVTLESGHTLRIARPSVNNLVKTGQLPAELANAAIKVQSGGSLTDHDMRKYVEYNERIVKLSVVSPKVVDTPNYDNDEISLDDLSDSERNEILLYVNGGLEALAKFRSGGSGVSSGSDLS